ncbi:hypothetical protein [Streptomyces sp. NPDC005898]|uniref:hypothetical protein n=1 Tax=Streptomyces sp. NPDC005898 TaxID=3157082 RepID=UPI0033F40B7F
MRIVTFEEPHKQLSEDFGPGDAAIYIEAVHAAPADPPGSDTPTEMTICGKSTAGMTRLSYAPKSPGQPWCPPNKTQWMCTDCDEVLGST